MVLERCTSVSLLKTMLVLQATYFNESNLTIQLPYQVLLMRFREYMPELLVHGRKHFTGDVSITTPTSVGQELTEVACQQSTTTIQVTWTEFVDEESPIAT